MFRALLGLAIAGYAVLFAVPAIDRWLYRRRYPPLPAPEGFVVEFETPGARTGWLHYREGGRSARFDWEVGGKGAVLHVGVPDGAAWDEHVPWPRERRPDIVQRIADEVWRQRCRHCTWHFDGRDIVFSPISQA